MRVTPKTEKEIAEMGLIPAGVPHDAIDLKMLFDAPNVEGNASS